MSQYLLNIAARNSPNSSGNLMPVWPANNAIETSKVKAFGEEINFPDSGNQNQLIQQERVEIQPAIPQKISPNAVLKRTEIKEQMQTDEPKYFSKHVERVVGEEETKVIKNIATEPLTFSIKEPWQKLNLKKEEMVGNVKESDLIGKTIQKTTPEKNEAQKIAAQKTVEEKGEVFQDRGTIPVKTQVITPLVEKAADVKNNLLGNTQKIERLTPVQPEIGLPQKQHRNQSNQQANKLVIGKIIVEILPPKQPLPQKLITRVVQSAPKDSFPTSNKLSFGLGQL